MIWFLCAEFLRLVAAFRLDKTIYRCEFGALHGNFSIPMRSVTENRESGTHKAVINRMFALGRNRRIKPRMDTSRTNEITEHEFNLITTNQGLADEESLGSVL